MGTWRHPPVWQQRTADGAFSIVVAATSNSGVRLAIELVGRHNIVQPDGTFTGSTQFRHRVLAARGYVMASISHSDWARAGDPEKEVQYLNTRLQAALQSAAPSRP